MAASNFTTPVGRLVQGSLYTPNQNDAEGRPLLVKSGPNTGKPRVEYFVALAIPKVDGQHWAATSWGAEVWKAGHAFMAQAGQMPTFAWKVRDGDSTVPNKKQKRPCDQEGFPGHWILSFSSGFAPKTYSLVGATEPVLIDQKDAINLGDYVQINANVDGNDSPSQPGVFVNLGMVCLAGYGQRIVVGPDVSSAGFGGQPLPAGASVTPPAGFAPPAPAAPGVPAAPLAPVGFAPPPGVPAPAAPAPLVPVSVMPNPAFLQVPGAPTPPTPPAPAAPAARMVKAPDGAVHLYDALIIGGWTDALLAQNGYLAA